MSLDTAGFRIIRVHGRHLSRAQIGPVEIGQRDKTVKVVKCHCAVLKRHQPEFPQLPQHAVDMHRA